ncbi:MULTISPECIES: SDR family NAD(P)-dependent oxidoreductase [unclassified Halomonas]|uniref:SDR family NAD(P)-dependent oxidoreductase n=1 Tax=unclassified Halomonas TaxID=2609666 RepID=UPI000554A0A8|nr:MULTISPECIES: glucose 1-dehydrogenase [unclassified Halomonas]CEP35292.1 Putative 2-deoxy-D-gluconate 3-dehydrogenase [Halomonas sp. R57-5]
MNIFSLEGRVAVITGGNGGLGFGIASALHSYGATVVIAGRQKDKNKSAVERLSRLGGRVLGIEVDVADELSCKAMLAVVAEEFGRIDILVNNAGIAIRKPPEEYSVDEWRSVIDVNLSGAFYCSHHVYPYMVEVGGGKIINIGSMLSIFGMPLSVPYGASKGGIVQMGRSFAAAWADKNIQVNAILPGWVDTEMTRETRSQVKDLHQRVIDRTPAKRWGLPSDFAGVAVFLASSASDFVTGVALPVDGGFSISG